VAQPRYFSLGWAPDFIVESRRETLLAHRIRPLRIALKNQRDDLLAFAQVLDEKLVEIAQRFDTLYLVRAVCLLQKKALFLCLLAAQSFAPSITRKVSPLMAAVSQAMQQTPRASSLVENLIQGCAIFFSSVVNWVPSIWTYYSFSSTIARLCAVSVPNEWARVPPIDDGNPMLTGWSFWV